MLDPCVAHPQGSHGLGEMARTWGHMAWVPGQGSGIVLGYRQTSGKVRLYPRKLQLFDTSWSAHEGKKRKNLDSFQIQTLKRFLKLIISSMNKREREKNSIPNKVWMPQSTPSLLQTQMWVMGMCAPSVQRSLGIPLALSHVGQLLRALCFINVALLSPPRLWKDFCKKTLNRILKPCLSLKERKCPFEFLGHDDWAGIQEHCSYIEIPVGYSCPYLFMQVKL